VATTGQPGLIKPSSIRRGQIVFAITNPYAEIEPAAALAAGAAFAADGATVNNVLGYPGIFKGALMAGASTITVGMKLAAARALAGLVQEAELVPDPLDRAVHDTVAAAVREAAAADGVARPEMAAVGL
jgi:malate dehydrogenase (oxaloacetate-decarboxylating)